MVDDIDKKLRDLGRATDDIRPTDAFTGAVVDGLEADNPLVALATATDGLTLSDDFSDAVMARIMALPALAEPAASEDPLLRAARATADLRPTDDFTSAVMSAIEEQAAESQASISDAPRQSLYQDVGGSARSGLAFAALAAAACLLLSWYTQRDFDTQLMLQANNVEDFE